MSRKDLFLISLLILAAGVNFLSAFGPELGFDALWYHLTIPKLYLSAGKIYHIPGGLLYYSELPRLAEMIYIPLIKYFGETGPYLLNWAAGIGSAVILYKLSRKYFDQFNSLLVTSIWYITPLVGWQSGSAYVDLFRTFSEILALYFLFNKKIGLAGLAIGLAISTKTLSLGSLVILAVLSYLLYRDWKRTATMVLLAIIIAVPWSISSYLNTGYPFYPLGAGILDVRHRLFPQGANVLSLFSDFWKLSLFPEDPITPVYLIFLPFLFLRIKAVFHRVGPIVVYVVLSYLIWWITPRTGGGRFLLPYLPALSLVCIAVLESVEDRVIKKLLFLSIIAVALMNIVYRGVSNSRVLPYLLVRETKEEYLCRNLNFKTSVFVDCDGWFARNIGPTDLVYVAGVHNLYYINFPFVHESWYRGEDFNYMLTQGDVNPAVKKYLKYRTYQQVYDNTLTKVKLYRFQQVN